MLRVMTRRLLSRAVTCWVSPFAMAVGARVAARASAAASVRSMRIREGMRASLAALGGTPMGEPFDVMGTGRMALFQDPTGAVLALWQPGTSIGAEVVNGHGALSLNQLNTSDPEAAQRFYEALLGWRFEHVGTAETPYWGIYNGDRLNGGMSPLPPGTPAPSHWLVYLRVEDIDAAAAQIGSSGGPVMVEPREVPGGRILVAQDPQGAVFALFAGRFDD